MSTADILKAVACCAVVIAGALVWLFCSRQTLVARNVQAAVAIGIRIILVHAVTIPVLCIGGGIPINYLAVPYALFVLLTPVVTLEVLPIAGAVEVIITALVIFPPYVVKQFVLGFPDRGKFVLEPPDHGARTDPGEARVAALVTAESAVVTATVVAPLKPFGYIEVNGERIAASAVGGVMIDAGKQVRICGRNNQTVLVEVVGEYNVCE